jgi:hypothetical protein
MNTLQQIVSLYLSLSHKSYYISKLGSSFLMTLYKQYLPLFTLSLCKWQFISYIGYAALNDKFIINNKFERM